MNREHALIIIRFIVVIIAIVSLTVYGIVLASLGIDRYIAITIAGIIGGLAGFNIREILNLLKSIIHVEHGEDKTR